MRTAWDLWYIKHINIWITRVQEEERERAENIFEDTAAGNLPNLRKDTDNQVQETQEVPNRINPRRTHQDIKIRDREC